VASLGVAMAGCSAEDGSEIQAQSLAIVEQWITAVNADNAVQFEKFHTESVAFYSHLSAQPSLGRSKVWESFRHANSRTLEKTHMFGQQQKVALQVTAEDGKRSFLYVFYFEQDLISHVYGYSGDYALSAAPLFEGAPVTTDNTGLQQRIETIDSQPDALNNRDFTRFLDTFHQDSILYVPLSQEPVNGTEMILDDVQTFIEFFPEVELSVFQTGGQGNLIGQQLAVKNGPMKSLGFVHLFEGDRVSRVYEYLSGAELPMGAS
jgi:ketosteroid isomerase-like protein